MYLSDNNSNLEYKVPYPDVVNTVNWLLAFRHYQNKHSSFLHWFLNDAPVCRVLALVFLGSTAHYHVYLDKIASLYSIILLKLIKKLGVTLMFPISEIS